MDMSGHKKTVVGPDRKLIGSVLQALSKIDRATRTQSGLAKRAGKSRVTLDKVLSGVEVRDDTLEAFDDAVLLPPGTLLAVGNRDAELLNRLTIDPALRVVIDRELALTDQKRESPRRRNQNVV